MLIANGAIYLNKTDRFIDGHSNLGDTEWIDMVELSGGQRVNIARRYVTTPNYTTIQPEVVSAEGYPL